MHSIPAHQQETLKMACANFFEVGAAIPPPRDLNDAERCLLAANFTNITPENCMKPKAIEPEEGKYTFDAADELVAFARENGLKVNGHTLLWHSACPDWFFQDGNKKAARELVLRRMHDHIAAEAGHFRGMISSWDVVNEAIDDGDEYLRQTEWLAAIGADYIAEAFLAAHAADPGADLYYNDYSIEMPAKREKTLRLIRDLKNNDIPIHAIGIQGHWCLDEVPFKEIEDAIIAFHAEGLKVAITELDLDVVPRNLAGADTAQRESGVDDPYPDECPPDILARQAEQYGRLFALFRKHSDKISRVTFWGLHDGRSWLNKWPRKRTDYPLLWGRDLQPTPAFGSALAGLRSS